MASLAGTSETRVDTACKAMLWIISSTVVQQSGRMETLYFSLVETPVYVVWDDHEVRNNFSGPYDEQMPAGRQALREYWPIASPAEEPNRLYRTIRYGADLELFILDTRQYRSRDTDLDGPVKTMLGAAQLQWLIEGLTRSSATWKIIATSVPLSVPKGGLGYSDGWAAGA